MSVTRGRMGRKTATIGFVPSLESPSLKSRSRTSVKNEKQWLLAGLSFIPHPFRFVALQRCRARSPALERQSVAVAWSDHIRADRQPGFLLSTFALRLLS